MREIKFRAWDLLTQLMISPETIKNENLYDYIFNSGNCYVMQYTGLKDMNGREIYEGDIILTCAGWKDVIKWDDVYGAFVLGEEEFLYEMNFARDQVIGNIYQNSGLNKEV
jgi:uncharacterized phage protein (TIGR01671 family)